MRDRRHERRRGGGVATTPGKIKSPAGGTWGASGRRNRKETLRVRKKKSSVFLMQRRPFQKRSGFYSWGIKNHMDCRGMQTAPSSRAGQPARQQLERKGERLRRVHGLKLATSRRLIATGDHFGDQPAKKMSQTKTIPIEGGKASGSPRGRQRTAKLRLNESRQWPRIDRGSVKAPGERNAQRSGYRWRAVPNQKTPRGRKTEGEARSLGGKKSAI